MKKFSVLAILIALIAASFALPSFAEGNCDPSVDYLALGQSQLDAKDLEGALHSANCGLSFEETYELYMLRGFVYCGMGEFDLSAADRTSAIELDPDNAEAYNYRGWAYYQGGNLDEAMADYNYALELDAELHYAYNNRGLVWQAWGELELAKADYEMAIELGLPHHWAATNLYNVNFEIAKLAAQAEQ